MSLAHVKRCLFNKYLLWAHYMPDAVVNAEQISATNPQKHSWPHETHILVEKTGNKQNHQVNYPLCYKGGRYGEEK